MKAISLTQPWATLVAIGAKKIETRSWKTNYRGPLAIQAAKKYSKEAIALSYVDPFRSVLLKAGYAYPTGTLPHLRLLPLGAVIATCTLVICIQIKEGLENYFICYPGVGDIELPPGQPERSFGDYRSGRYAWVLSDIQPLPEPIPAKGALGLWEWEPEAK